MVEGMNLLHVTPTHGLIFNLVSDAAKLKAKLVPKKPHVKKVGQLRGREPTASW